MGSLSFVSFVLLSNIVGDLGGGSGNSSMTNTAASLLHRLLITLIPQMFPSPPTCINNTSFLFHKFLDHKGSYLQGSVRHYRPPASMETLSGFVVVKLVLTPSP